MDAVRIEGTARSSLTRKRKISKLSRRIETRRQVSLFETLLKPFLITVSIVIFSVKGKLEHRPLKQLTSHTSMGHFDKL